MVSRSFLECMDDTYTQTHLFLDPVAESPGIPLPSMRSCHTLHHLPFGALVGGHQDARCSAH